MWMLFVFFLPVFLSKNIWSVRSLAFINNHCFPFPSRVLLMGYHCPNPTWGHDDSPHRSCSRSIFHSFNEY